MNRAQFMEQLEKLLSDISEEERQEALDYYESYFDDAGEDQEANVIRELGSPGKVAAIIKADLRESSQNYGEYTENGFQDDRVKEDMQMPEQRGSRAERGYHAERKGSNAGVILVLILLVFISPLIKGAVGGVLGFIVALALLPCLIVFGIGAAVVGLFAAGIAVIGAGIGACFSASIGFGILGIGVGLLILALALVGLVFLVWAATKVLPAILRKFIDFCSRLVNRGSKKKEAGL